MNVPLMLIDILADGKFHSDEQIIKNLGISQLEINKHINTLYKWGLDILIIPSMGYKLSAPIQLLDENIIRSQIRGSRVTILPVIDSTNQYFLDRIDDLNSGDSCIAECQQAGRGRRGHKWFSPFGVNLYLSMFWRLGQGSASTVGLSLMTSIVVAKVLQKLGADNVRVKWPNDLYLYDRKLAGILIELICKTGDAAKIVIGAGINIVMRNVHIDVINQAWITLRESGASLDRNDLTVCLINELRSSLEIFERKGLTPFLSLWEKLDNFINRQIRLNIGNKEIYGISRGINAQGALMLEQVGIIKPWMGGEISLYSAE